MIVLARCRRVAIALFATGFAGCIASKEPILTPQSGTFRPLTTGYWQGCDFVDNKPPACKTYRVDYLRGNMGVFWMAGDGKPGTFIAVPLSESSFVLQFSEYNILMLGRRQAAGVVAFYSPNCRFPDALKRRLRDQGVNLDYQDKDCAPLTKTVESVVTLFRTLDANDTWISEAQTVFTPLGPAEGAAAFRRESAAS